MKTAEHSKAKQSEAQQRERESDDRGEQMQSAQPTKKVFAANDFDCKMNLLFAFHCF